MKFYLLITTAIALSMDAFAVAVSCGISNNINNIKQQLKIAITFGIFQGIMPIIGWLLSSSFALEIQAYGHWVAFILLSIIGGKMIKESRDIKHNQMDTLTFKTLIFLAVATSIDALATGISFAVLNVNIYLASVIISVITFILSYYGAKFGRKLGHKYQSGAEFIGGIILILIGIKILYEHIIVG